MDRDRIQATLKRALGLQQAGRLAEAFDDYEAVLASDPDNADALHLSGLILLEHGALEPSLERLAAATRLRPGFKSAFNSLGNALKAAGRLDQACLAYRRALALDAGYLAAWINLGSACSALGDFAAAEDCFRRVLASDPGNVAALFNAGNAFAAQGRHAEALAAFQRAHQSSPGDAEILLALVQACRRCGRHDDAMACCRQALQLAPDSAAAHNALGALLQEQGAPAAALAAYRQALARDPELADARFNAATVLLQGADYDAGWRLYESRWQLPAARSMRRDFAPPLWLGDFDLHGRTILLHAEQGFGDTLQFVRFVPLVAARGARVLLEVQAALKPLLASLDGVTTLLARGEALPDFDCHCPLLSLPLAFAVRATDIPATIPYLAPEPRRVDAWRRYLDETPGPRIGLVWSAGRGGENPHDKSLPLAGLMQAFDGIPCHFIALHTEYLERDRAALQAASRLQPMHDRLGDFADTAALIATLDLVISIDSAVAHLAGALGAPTWTLLHFAADWRWLLERDDSPWYPGMRLYRQPAPGDWQSLLPTVAAALRGFVAGWRRP